MRILTSSLICAGILCAAVSLRADDNAAQAAARAALMQKMQEMDSQSNNPAPPPAPAPAAPENPVPPVATTPENQTPPAPPVSEPQPETKPATAPENTAPQMSAQEMQQVQALEAEHAARLATPPVPVLPPQPVTNENSVQAEEQAIVSQHVNKSEPATNTLPVMNEMTAPPSPPPVAMPPPQPKTGFFSRILHPFRGTSRPTVVEEQPMKRATPAHAEKNNSGFAPIQPPPPPVSPEQDAQLQDLLQKYKADQISPEEYQTERAEIIGTR